jgi:hypothetical protein
LLPMPISLAQNIPVTCASRTSRKFNKMSSYEVGSRPGSIPNRQPFDGKKSTGRSCRPRQSTTGLTSLPAGFTRTAVGGVLLWLWLFSLPATPLLAAPKVSCDIEVVAQHPALVTFTWSVRVASEKTWDACDLVISFQNERGEIVHVVRETISLQAGQSSFTGTDICESGTWKGVRKYVATLDCVF